MAAIRFQCAGCGQHLEAPDQAIGCEVACPSCRLLLRVPSEPLPAPATPGQPAAAGLCAICQSPVAPGEARTACPDCGAEYHTECWQENGGCAVYGCAQVPQVEARRAIEIPISYWGQENKPCPSCGREILAAALRCRHCGATFSSARPEDADEFTARTARSDRLPRARKLVVWLFVLSVVPCCAPVGAVAAPIWYFNNREDVRALPSLYGALAKIGMIVGIGQTVGVAVMVFLYALVRGH